MNLAPKPVRRSLDAIPLPDYQLFPFLSIHWSLFALFFHTPPFVFNSLQPLFRKHPGWGYLYKSPLLESTTSSLFFPPLFARQLPQLSILPFVRVSAPPRQSIYCPFVFILLQIPFPATPSFSLLSKTPGGCGGPPSAFRRGDPSDVTC